jgi:hypothetical protein
MEKQLNTKRDSSRPRRTPLAGRNRLAVRDQDPNYVYRIVNTNLDSDPDRVQNLVDAGYEIVPSKKAGPVGDTKVDNPSALGSAGQISVGQGTKAIVMRIPREYYEEDQRLKEAELTEMETRPRSVADYGTLELSSTKGK